MSLTNPMNEIYNNSDSVINGDDICPYKLLIGDYEEPTMAKGKWQSCVALGRGDVGQWQCSVRSGVCGSVLSNSNSKCTTNSGNMVAVAVWWKGVVFMATSNTIVVFLLWSIVHVLSII